MNTERLRLLTFIFLFSSIFGSSLFCQEETTISSKRLLKDFDQFMDFLEVHPDPFTHCPQEKYYHEIEQVRVSLKEPQTLLEYYKKLSFLVALMKDGHSSVHLPESWMKKQMKKHGVFPYEVYLDNNSELYILKNYHNGDILPGSRIISINNLPVDSFIKNIDPYISYERPHFRNTIIDDEFQKFLYLQFGVINNIKLEYFASDTLSEDVTFVPYKEWQSTKKMERSDREKLISLGKPYEYKKVKDGIGMINIFSFSADNLNDYNIFLMNTFKKIKQDSIHSLIIDVRGNYGGWPKIAAELFHYISDTYFKTMAMSHLKISGAYKNFIFNRYPFLRHNRSFIPERKHFIDLQAVVSEPAGSFVTESSFFNIEPHREDYEFTGDCYLLINRDSYSAASSFASTFQCYQMGPIIGEETGGTKIFRANAITEKLNKTGILISLSTTKLFTTCFTEEF